jgi:hypothetical protein
MKYLTIDKTAKISIYSKSIKPTTNSELIIVDLVENQVSYDGGNLWVLTKWAR